MDWYTCNWNWCVVVIALKRHLSQHKLEWYHLKYYCCMLTAYRCLHQPYIILNHTSTDLIPTLTYIFSFPKCYATMCKIDSAMYDEKLNSLTNRVVSIGCQWTYSWFTICNVCQVFTIDIISLGFWESALWQRKSSKLNNDIHWSQFSSCQPTKHVCKERWYAWVYLLLVNKWEQVFHIYIYIYIAI